MRFRDVRMVGSVVALDYNAAIVMGATVVIGLGNPGKEYAATRHNVGFRCVDHFAKKHSARFSRTGCRSKLADVTLRGRQVVLAKPRTYMNLSGEAAACFVRAHRIPAEDLILVYDDVDLPLGKIRLKWAGGNGGHKGLRSIDAALGRADYFRIRVGVGRPAVGSVTDHVLSRFSSADRAQLTLALDGAVESVRTLLFEGLKPAQNQIHGRLFGQSADSEAATET